MFGKVTFGNNLVLTAGSAEDIMDDEIAHVITLRNALQANGVRPIAKSAINLDALATGGASLQNQQNFLVLAQGFEDIGVSAYNGGASLLRWRAQISFRPLQEITFPRQIRRMG